MGRNTAVALGGVAGFAALVLVPLASAFACGPLASLSVAPASAPPGTEIAASGKGFSGGSGGSPSAGPVIVRFGTTTGPILWEGRPDAAGAITAAFTVPVASPGTYSVIATQDSADGTPAPGTPARATLEVLPQPTTTTTTTTTTPPAPTTAAATSAASTPPEPSPTDPPAAAGQGRATTTTAATATTTMAATTRAPTRGAPVPTSATTTVASSVAGPAAASPATVAAAPAAAAPVDAGEPGAPMVRAGLAPKPVTHTAHDATPALVIVAGLMAVATGAGGLTVRRRRSSASS